MDLSLLRSLVVVAEAGAITEAANRLGLTQPALSRRIQLLEAEFDAELLSRSRKGAQLTEMGRLVVREARVLIDRYDSLKNDVASHSTLEGGTVRIGGGATFVSFVLPDAIAKFQRVYPKVHFHVKETSSSEIASDVADGRLELGLVTQPVRTTGLEVSPLIDDQIVLIASAENDLAKQSEVSLEILEGQNFVGFEGGSAIRQIVDASLREAGVEINVVMELRSIPAIVRMVMTTGNLAFVSQMGVRGESGVRTLKVQDLNIRRQLALITRAGAQTSPAAQKFATQLLAEKI